MASSDNVTHKEFEQTLQLLGEIRKMINERVDTLSDQLTEGINQITKRQDISNGRLSKHEERLLELETEVKTTEQVATDIKEHGCHRLAEHEAQVEVLEDAGVTKWKPAAKTGALVGGGLATGLFIRYAGEIFHWVGLVFSGK